MSGGGAGQLRSPACWCRWSWGRSHHCSHRCIHQYLCKPASRMGETIDLLPPQLLQETHPMPAACLRHCSPSEQILAGSASPARPCSSTNRSTHGQAPQHRTHLLAGLRVVGPHTRDGVAPIATGTGLTAEAGCRVDALRAGEAGVGMSALRARGERKALPRVRHRREHPGGSVPAGWLRDTYGEGKHLVCDTCPCCLPALGLRPPPLTGTRPAHLIDVGAVCAVALQARRTGPAAVPGVLVRLHAVHAAEAGVGVAARTVLVEACGDEGRAAW